MTPNPVLATFFQRHGGVRATDSGPCWSQADEATLLDWYRQYRAAVVHGLIKRFNGSWYGEYVRDASPEERAAMLPMYNELCAEIVSRSKREGVSAPIMAAALTMNMGQ